MRVKELKKLEKYSDAVNETFNSGYKRIDQALHWFSILGHVGVILVGYVYIQTLLLDVKSTIPVWAATLIAGVFLAIFEMLKREVIGRFSVEHVQAKFNMTAGVLGLLGTSLLAMGFSFYVTFSGANKFSNKSETIVMETQADEQYITDSLSKMYQQQMDEEAEKWEEKASQYRDSKKMLQQAVQKRESDNVRHAKRMGWSDASATAYKNNLESNERDRAEMERLTQKIDGYEARRDSSVAKLERQRDEAIAKQLAYLESDFERSSKKNESNYMAFIIISILLETVIMFGIYFNQYYRIRSGREYSVLRSSDPRLQKYLRWSKILTVIYDPNVTPALDQPIPSARDLEVLLDARGLTVKQSELNGEFFKMLSSLNIVETRGGKRYLKKQHEEAVDAINSQFDI